MIPKFLYHGTSLNKASSIKSNGLLPRSELSSEFSHNWENCPSNQNAVYLTSAFAHFYAASACKEDEDLLILRIDTTKLDCKLFCSDEDALAQSYLGHDNLPKMTMEERTKYYRDKIFKYSANASLRSLGTCCYYGKIPRKAICDSISMTQKDYAKLVICGYDPTITVGCYQFLKEKYENLCKATFSGWNKNLAFNKQTHKQIFKKAKLA